MQGFLHWCARSPLARAPAAGTHYTTPVRSPGSGADLSHLAIDCPPPLSSRCSDATTHHVVHPLTLLSCHQPMPAGTLLPAGLFVSLVTCCCVCIAMCCALGVLVCTPGPAGCLAPGDGQDVLGHWGSPHAPCTCTAQYVCGVTATHHHSPYTPTPHAQVQACSTSSPPASPTTCSSPVPPPWPYAWYICTLLPACWEAV